MKPTPQASDLDVEGLSARLLKSAGELDMLTTFSMSARGTRAINRMREAASALQSLSAQLAAAVANLAAANKQIEAMDLALEFYASEARAAKKHMATNNAAPLEAILTVLALDGGGRADNARTALSHEAHNG